MRGKEIGKFEFGENRAQAVEKYPLPACNMREIGLLWDCWLSSFEIPLIAIHSNFIMR